MQVENRNSITTQISSIVAQFGNLENFKEIMESRGYIVIKLEYITWFYVTQIISGQKKSFKSHQLTDFVVPPRYVHKICWSRSKSGFLRLDNK